MKLKEMSLPLEILNKVEEIETVEELPAGFEEIIDEVEAIEEDVTEEPELEVETVELEENDDNEPEVVEEEIVEEEVEEDSIVEEEPAEDVKLSEEKEEEAPKPKVDTSKIQLIKKALDKAREKGNDQLVKVLEQQLLKELENLK